MAADDDAYEIVRSANDAWNSAFNRGDCDAVAACYAPDATVLPHTHDVLKGTDAIHGFWKSLIDGGFGEHAIEIITVHRGQDLVVEIGKWSATGPGDDGSPSPYGGSIVNVFEKHDGRWLCRTHIWN